MQAVTVFGGSNPSPFDYDQAFTLGRRLATAGYAVITGGYIGTMEAVSKGAAEAGGHVIGITCDEIEGWRPVRPNPWVKEERRYPTLRQRLFALIEDGHAAISLPGGLGTLAEISVMWTHLLIGAISPRPLILVGEGWKTTFERFFLTFDGYIPEGQKQWVTYASDITAAMKTLSERL